MPARGPTPSGSQSGTADRSLLVPGGTANVVASAADAGTDVGTVERGPLGGTCLDRGCNPSKKRVHRATVARTVHVHPALSKVVRGAFRDACDPGLTGICG